MSHIVKMKVKVKNLNVIKSIVSKLNGTIQEAKSFQYYGSRSEKCDYEINIPTIRGKIGVINEGTHYSFKSDSMYDAQFTKAFNTALVDYATNVMCEEQGYVLESRETNSVGEVVIRLKR